MKETEFYRWWVPDAWSGKLGLTRYKMTVADAQERFPGCKPDPQSREVRDLPETREELMRSATSPYRRR